MHYVVEIVTFKENGFGVLLPYTSQNQTYIDFDGTIYSRM